MPNVDIQTAIQRARQMGMPEDVIKRKVQETYGDFSEYENPLLEPQRLNLRREGPLQDIARSIAMPAAKGAGLIMEAGGQVGRLAQDLTGQTTAQERARRDPFIFRTNEETVRNISGRPWQGALEGYKGGAGIASLVSLMSPGALTSNLTKPAAVRTIARPSLGQQALNIGGRSALEAFLGESAQEDATLGSVAKATGTSAVLAPALTVGPQLALRGGRRLLGGAKRKAAGMVSEQAAQGINKATPSAYTNAIEDYGRDLNQLTIKYNVPGADYDDWLGPAGKRSKGGLIKDFLEEAEGRIGAVMDDKGDEVIDMTPFYRNLNQKAAALEEIPGNENYAKALTDFINEAGEKYGYKMKANRALDLKRKIDSKFGAKVTDEGTGRIAAQGQKELGNYLRSQLKNTYPELADALDQQTDMYILRDILSTARGKGTKTRGSSIRKGALNNLTDLINPLAWSEKAFANPKISSRIIQAARPSAGRAAGRVIPQLPGQVSRIMTRGLTSLDTGKETTQMPNQQIQAQPKPFAIGPTGELIQAGQQTQPVIPQAPAGQFQRPMPGQQAAMPQAGGQRPFGGMSKQELLQLAAQQPGATNARLKMLSDRYDMLMGTGGEQDMNVGQVTAQNYANAASGLKSLENVKQIISRGKLLGARVPGKPFGRDLAAEMYNVADTLLRLRTGAQANETEIRKLARDLMPGPLDSEAVIQRKLDILENNFADILRMGRGQQQGVPTSPGDMF